MQTIKKKIKVLIVDDSLIFRETISKAMSNDIGLEVVATAVDAYMARDKIIEFEPDVMTLDVEMPKMSGIEFLRKLMPQYPMPVIVVSGVNKNVFDALNAGAVDFVAKPSTSNLNGLDSFINELIVKVKIASTAKVGNWRSITTVNNSIKSLKTGVSDGVIAIGASTGGTEAISYILQTFPKEMPGIVVTQHMPPIFTKMYAERLNNICLMEIKEAQDGDKILPGRVLIAPGEHHMVVKKKGNDHYVECFKGERVNGFCPSVDVLFNSVAEKVGSSAIGVILTGMGQDGAKGLLNMRSKGARTIGQNESTCVVYGMPKVAYDIGAVEKQVPLEAIPKLVHSFLNGGSK